MRDCEPYETLVSAWHDGELDRDGQVEMLDHLVRCADCRGFYLGARGLAGLVNAFRSPAALESPSSEVWGRIERSARSGEPGRTRGGSGAWMRRFPISAWAAAAAAIVLLVLFGPPLGRGPIPVDAPKAGAIIRLGEDPAGMDDERFVELTKRVLGADRKYRTALYQVMKQVVQDTQGDDSSGDVLLPSEEGREGAEPPEGAVSPS